MKKTPYSRNTKLCELISCEYLFFRSFMETAGASVTKQEIDTAVDSIFEDAGDDDEISLEQFTRAMLKDNRSTFESAKLSLPGCLKLKKNF